MNGEMNEYTGLVSINGAATSDEFGFSLNPIKAVKKVGRGIAKGAKGAAKGVAAGARAAASVATLPFRLALRAVIQLAIPLGRTLCTVPPSILSVGATAAGVSMNVVPMFCTALNLRNMGEVRRLLPPVLKIAVKVAATGAVPGIGPALSAIRAVPGLKLVPGLSFLAGVDSDEMAMAEIDGLGEALAGVSDEEMADAIDGCCGFGATPSNFKTGALITGLALVSGTGVYFAMKRKRRRRR